MATGPETITVFKVLKRDGDYVKFDDNQQHKWNCSIGEISSHIKEGLTIDVWWDPYEGTLPDGSAYTSKYIQKASPSTKPEQELKEPFKGGSGGRGGGGGSKKDGDFRTRGELIALEALRSASVMHSNVFREGSALEEDAVRKVRASIMKTADIFCEYIVEQGKKLKNEPAVQEQTAWADDKPDPAEPNPAPKTGWGTPAATEDPDGDIPF